MKIIFYIFAVHPQEPRDDSDTSQLHAAKNIRRKNKREWIQRKKKRLVEEEKEVLERRAEKHRAIDERLEVLRQQDCKKKLVSCVVICQAIFICYLNYISLCCYRIMHRSKKRDVF